MDLISIITVNFNQPAITIDFLRSVTEKSNYDNVEVILVDNGSAENYENEFRAAFPGLIYIRSEKNLGFAGGNNLGIKSANGKYLLFLNNDTELADNLLDVLSSELRDKKEIGMVSPLILYFDQPNIIQNAGFTEMNYLTCRNKGIGSMEMNVGQYDKTSHKTAYFHGAAMMCRKADLDEVGTMDENFFLYYEEFDWCEKFKRAGKVAWFTGYTKIYHKESVSVGKESKLKTYFMNRNRMLFIRRNTNPINYAVFFLYFTLIACSKQTFRYFLDRRWDLIKWLWKGVAWNLQNSKNSKIIGIQV